MQQKQHLQHYWELQISSFWSQQSLSAAIPSDSPHKPHFRGESSTFLALCWFPCRQVNHSCWNCCRGISPGKEGQQSCSLFPGQWPGRHRHLQGTASPALVPVPLQTWSLRCSLKTQGLGHTRAHMSHCHTFKHPQGGEHFLHTSQTQPGSPAADGTHTRC